MNPEKYFTLEKNFCLFGAVYGALSIAAALYFLLKLKQPFYNGLSYPLLLLGLLFLVVCGGVFLRSDKDLSRVNAMLTHAKEQIKTEEIPRMQKVMRSFHAIIIVEIVLILLSLFFLFFMRTGPITSGVFWSILVQAGLLLFFDLVARQRGQSYLEFLKTIVISTP